MSDDNTCAEDQLNHRPKTGRVNGYGWVIFLSFHILSALVMVGLLATTPEPSGKVALIYPPHMTAAEAFLRAVSSGARPIRHGNVGWIVVVAPEQDDRDFTARAHASGALALLNPVVAGGCSDDAASSAGSRYRRFP